jgi:hypothetical protein
MLMIEAVSTDVDNGCEWYPTKLAGWGDPGNAERYQLDS